MNKKIVHDALILFAFTAEDRKKTTNSEIY